MNCSLNSLPINKLCNGFPSNSVLCLGRKLSENHIRCRNHKQTNSLRVFQNAKYKPRFITSASSSDQNQKGNVPSQRFDRTEPFGGKSGSVSFYGLTHQVIEEGKLVSAPFKEGKGSFLWVLAPIALMSSLVLPQFFLSNAIESFIRDDILAEIVASFLSETMFYIGLAAFLKVTDHVQRPYLEYSPKRWGLITGLNGYLSSAFFTMGFKVVAPLFAVYVTWPELGLAAPVVVAPFLIGCAAQFAFEVNLEKRDSSCWPLVPIIFEVYRLYQLSKAAHFIERMMMSMMGIKASSQLVARSKALLALLVTLQVLGIVCLWSLITFLLRLFPSRPVAEKY
ncbi:tRNA-processing ribonuclease BN [Thalictrum thalictroides]|uniref:tRNA-processing ribonuclease BN n=1 Tax=Thalictrum thalictroides TaxID=46969 RepID=A0A7J6X677_THATH|nr:tRNA-processing ribonuclease BN [Thalictrum thalictroides]